jgi:hypothetical protein
MGIGKKITKGSMGGGVNISHKSKMSQSAKNQMSFPGGMPGPGNYGSTNNNVVGKGMAQYMAGEAVGMKKYGKHKGTAKMDPMHNGEPGVQKEDFEQFSAPKSTGPGKYTRLDKTKAKAKDAKDAANEKVKKLNKTQAEVDSMKRSKAKADRLAKRQKRQEGRAERKKIRKDYKDQKGKRTYVDSKDNPTDERTTTSRLVTNLSKKQKQIKASRKKQKAKDPVVEKESSSGKGGMMKAGDPKRLAAHILKKKGKKVNEMSNRRRKDTYSYQEPKAKVLKK